MPIKECTLPGGGSGYKWGESGKCYPDRKSAERQAAAAHANGYTGSDNMTVISVKDAIEVGDRSFTVDGYMIAKNSVLARVGVQPYLRRELGLDGDGIIKLYRPPEEVFDADSLASFEHKPITIDHPMNGVNASNWAKLAKGEAVDIGRRESLMTGTLIIKSGDAITAANNGKNQLSNGYSFHLDMTPGITPDGIAYDGVQRKIRGNHIAIVDSARCGSACKISDTNKEVITMADSKRKIIVDGIPYDADDATAAIIEKITKQRDDLLTAKDSAEAKVVEYDKLLKQVKDQALEIETLKKDVMTPDARDALVADWAKMLIDAKRIAPELVTDGKTCATIRREVVSLASAANDTTKTVVSAIIGGASDLTKVEDSVIKQAFDAIAALAVKAMDESKHGNAVSMAFIGDGQQSKKSEPLVGRDLMLARQQGLIKQEGK